MRILRIKQSPRGYVWILYYNWKYLTLLTTLCYSYWSYSCHRLPIKSLLYMAKLWYFCFSQLYHRLHKKRIVWHSCLSQLCHNHLQRVYFLLFSYHSFSLCFSWIMCRYRNMSTLGICLNHNQYHFQENSKLDAFPNDNHSLLI